MIGIGSCVLGHFAERARDGTQRWKPVFALLGQGGGEPEPVGPGGLNVSKTSAADPNGSGYVDPEQWGEPAGMPRRRKTGGRARGTPNKKTAERAKLLSALKVDGKDPVSFFASILKNEDAPLDLRFNAAKELAPYAHPKLASIEARTGGKTHEDRLVELQSILADEEGGVP